MAAGRSKVRPRLSVGDLPYAVAAHVPVAVPPAAPDPDAVADLHEMSTRFAGGGLTGRCPPPGWLSRGASAKRRSTVRGPPRRWPRCRRRPARGPSAQTPSSAQTAAHRSMSRLSAPWQYSWASRRIASSLCTRSRRAARSPSSSFTSRARATPAGRDAPRPSWCRPRGPGRPRVVGRTSKIRSSRSSSRDVKSSGAHVLPGPPAKTCHSGGRSD